MTTRRRLDSELVRRGLAASRTEAKAAVERGVVLVAGIPATRAATLVDGATSLSLAEPSRRFVSRGGDKLDGALSRLEIDVAGLRWLDAGASTGGFTDCLLQRGATAVVAVDVGYGQIAWKLRQDGRVAVVERVNARDLTPELLPWPADGVVADLSFISLTSVLPALVRCARPDARFVLLVKPQFEAGRAALSKGGVVRDVAERRRAVLKVVDAAHALGLDATGVTRSEPPGPAGNREVFLLLERAGDGDLSGLDDAVGPAGVH